MKNWTTINILVALFVLMVGCDRSDSSAAQDDDKRWPGKGRVRTPGSASGSDPDRIRQPHGTESLPNARVDRVRARLATAEGLDRSNYLLELLYEMGEWRAEEVEQFLADENLLRAALAAHPNALGAAVAATTPDGGILVLEKLTGDPGRLVMQGFFTKLAEKSPAKAAELFARVESRSNLTAAAREIGGRFLFADSESALKWVETLTLPEIRDAALQSMAYGTALLSDRHRGELASMIVASKSNSLRDHLIQAWSQGAVQEWVSTESERGTARSAIARDLVVPSFDGAPESIRESLQREFLYEAFLSLSSLRLNAKPESFEEPLRVAADISSVASSQGMPDITRRIGSRLAYIDPAAAVDFFQAVEDPSARVEAVTGIVATWVHADSVAAGEWVAGLQGQDPAVMRAAGGEIVRYLSRLGDADNLNEWNEFVSSFEEQESPAP